MTRRIGQLSLWLGLGVTLLVTAYLIINTTFMLYDDEGYVLLTYRNFNAGGRLYDEIFSQYGPWPYVYHWLISLGVDGPLTHAVGRNLTALHWVLCALLGGATTARLTGRMSAALFAAMITFGLLWQMGAEPSHPGSLISAMLAGTALAAAVSHAAARWNWLGVAIGLAAALLILTKINVGLFVVAGAGAAALRLTAWPEKWRRPAEILATTGLLLLPWSLMGRKLGEPWVLVFALQFTAAAAGLLWVTPPALFSRRIPPRTWAVALVVFIGAAALVSTTVCLRGTSVAALLQAVLIDPVRHPGSFMVGFPWRPFVWPVTAVCWAITLRAGWELRRTGEIGEITRWSVIAVRFAAPVSLILGAEAWMTLGGVSRFLICCLPLLPVFLVPLARREAGDSAGSGAIFWVACLALPQVLHAYPVAGSQMGWGTFLLLPVLVAGLHEAWRALGLHLPKLGRWVPRVCWSLLVLVASGQTFLLLHTGWTRYHTSQPLELPGAEDIRAGDFARQIMRVMTLNAAVHADVLFSRQGMYSYNIWSGVPTPTTRNATHWFWLLNAADQQAIINRLEHAPRSAVIISEGLDEFLARIHVPMTGPLQTHVNERYRPLLTVGTFHFMVPHASRAVPFSQFELLVLTTADKNEAYPALLRSNVVLAGRPASVQLQAIESPWAVREQFLPGPARITLEPISSVGDATGPALELPLSGPVRGLFRLSVYAKHQPDLARPRELLLKVLDADQAVLSESVY